MWLLSSLNYIKIEKLIYYNIHYNKLKSSIMQTIILFVFFVVGILLWIKYERYAEANRQRLAEAVRKAEYEKTNPVLRAVTGMFRGACYVSGNRDGIQMPVCQEEEHWRMIGSVMTAVLAVGATAVMTFPKQTPPSRSTSEPENISHTN